MRTGWFGESRRSAAKEAAAELVLISAIAEGRLNEASLDRFARALIERRELVGVGWTWLLSRAEQLTLQAPLFTEARARVAEGLRNSDLAPDALDFARRLVGPAAPQAEALLADVARRLRLRPPDLGPLPPTVQRCRFDDPSNPNDLPFHTALGMADPIERRLLLFKLRAARGCLHALGPKARLNAIGRRLPVGDDLFRASAEYGLPEGDALARFLAPGEALHRVERRLILALVANMVSGQQLVVAFESQLLPPDQELLSELPKDYVKQVNLRGR